MLGILSGHVESCLGGPRCRSAGKFPSMDCYHPETPRSITHTSRLLILFRPMGPGGTRGVGWDDCEIARGQSHMARGIRLEVE